MLENVKYVLKANDSVPSYSTGHKTKEMEYQN